MHNENHKAWQATEVVPSAFALTAPYLIRGGYSPLPIVRGGKAPGIHYPMRGWQAYCDNVALPNVIRGWSLIPGIGVGVACGRGLIAVDIDVEELVGPILAALPFPVVDKKGRKGLTAFYRGDTQKIPSRNYSSSQRGGLVDLLSWKRQTVLPPSIHPDTNQPYFWWTDATLCDTPLSELPELPNDIADQIGEVLRPFGYDPDRERAEMSTRNSGAPFSRSSSESVYRRANDDALANLDCWVPDLHLYRWRRKPGGYEAVAHWRSSGTGRALELRKRNLSIVRKGIEDFGDGRKYTPIDLVMAARGCTASAALDWLLECLPDDEPKIRLVNGPLTLARIRLRDHQNL